jgi:hypothetical protein
MAIDPAPLPSNEAEKQTAVPKPFGNENNISSR